MSRFTRATYVLAGAYDHGRPMVCLTSPMVYEVDFLGSGWKVEAPTGFCCDLASVPIIPAWMLRHAWGRALAALRDHLAERLARVCPP